MDRSDVLASLEPLFAHTNAEGEDRALLSQYFVETDAWKTLLSGTRDIIMGAKGSGKSALYLLLLRRKPDLAELNNVMLVPAEEPLGASAFQEAISERLRQDSLLQRREALISRREFSDLWIRYFFILTLARLRQEAQSNSTLRNRLRKSSEYTALIATLEEAGFLAREKDRQFSLGQILRRVMESIKLEVEVFPFKMEVYANPTRPTKDDKAPTTQAVLSMSDLFDRLNSVLVSADLTAWLLLDRLDDAFESQSASLEATGLGTLLKTYSNLRRYERIKLKLFVRSDIYARVLEDSAERIVGREKIERELSIDWERASLLDIIMSRMLQSAPLTTAYKLNRKAIDRLHREYGAQEELFYRIFPARVENVDTLAWIMGNLEDGNRRVTPRSLIKFVSFAMDRQRARNVQPDNGLLFDATSMIEAIAKASKEYYEKAFSPEYPLLRDYAQGLHGQAERNNVDALHAIWRAMRSRPDLGTLSAKTALKRADELAEVGFFRHAQNDPYYDVAPLYRAALEIRTGG